jgi:alpha-1,3-glucosyltransferase
VHEKSIMLPLLPITALAAWEPAVALWAPLLASFSMFPLLERDGIAMAYGACILIYSAVMLQLAPSATASQGKAQAAKRAPAPLVQRLGTLAAVGGTAAASALHIARALLPPPERLPWLHDRASISLSFFYVAAAMAYFNWLQWNQPGAGQLASAAESSKVDATASGEIGTTKPKAA